MAAAVARAAAAVGPHEVASPRWKEVVHPAAHVWMHHLELRTPEEVDEDVVGWLAEAYAAAG